MLRGAGIAVVLALALVPDAGAAGSGFTARVTNPWYPLLPGMRWVYKGSDEGRPARDVVRVLDRVKTIDGVPCAVVRDKVYVRGRLRERTTDWYTQDAHGTVHYYGEATAELDRHGKVVSREGSWRAGRRGARPGVFMPARPRVGDAFRQEFFPRHAEDHFRVVRLHASISVPFASFRGDVLRTREWTPLEPGVRDAKWYVRGLGQVAEATIRGGSERFELVSFRP
jgi:hypothetical protein